MAIQITDKEWDALVHEKWRLMVASLVFGHGYVERHDPQSITERLDAVCDEAGASDRAFARRAARQLTDRIEW